jgi:hypothetical protein
MDELAIADLSAVNRQYQGGCGSEHQDQQRSHSG